MSVQTHEVNGLSWVFSGANRKTSFLRRSMSRCIACYAVKWGGYRNELVDVRLGLGSQPPVEKKAMKRE